jgi:RNA polymerase sigma-70 factor (ECF subfamily)
VTESVSDTELIQRVQAGQRAAFDVLVRRYQQKVFNLVLRYVREPMEAEDVTQEAMIKAYRALPGFRGDSAFYTWLYRIAINTAKNRLSAASRKMFERLPVDEDGDSTAFVDSRLSDDATPERVLLSEEIQDTVNQAMQELPDELRQAIVMRELDGLSYEEIAQAMECPVGTVRSRIFRAREAIDRRLRPIFEGGIGRDEVHA